MFDIPSPGDKGWYLDEDEMLRPKLMTKDPAPQSQIETVHVTVRLRNVPRDAVVHPRHLPAQSLASAEVVKTV